MTYLIALFYLLVVTYGNHLHTQATLEPRSKRVFHYG